MAVLVGVIVGEQAAGLVCDWVMQKEKRCSKRQGRSLILERRLWAALPGYVLVPVGLVVLVLRCRSMSSVLPFPSPRFPF